MPATPDKTEEALRSLGCAFTRRADGMYVVDGDIKLSYTDTPVLPDLSSVIVTGNFTIAACGLTSLKGCPREVGADFWCHHNSLSSLEGGPEKVGGNYWCHENNLTSLAHAPEKIGGYFYCDRNDLTSLENAPREFVELHSDFGNFKSWGDIPDNIKFSAETRDRKAEEQASHDTLDRLRKIANDHPVKLKKPAIK